MTTQIIIGIGGLILSVLTYFAGVLRTEKRYKKQVQKNRIELVVSKYLELRRVNEDASWSGALKAGFANLASDEEIRVASSMIENYGENNPLTTNENIDSIDLKKLFEFVAKNQESFSKTPLKDLIKKSNA